MFQGNGKMEAKRVDAPLVILPVGFIHETPLQTTRETGTTTPSKTRVFDSLNNPGITLAENVFRPMPVSSRLVSM